MFYVFWEVMLVPMYFLIGVWGGPRKLYAAIKFFLYTLVGSVLLLLGILALYFHVSVDCSAASGDCGAVRNRDSTFNILAFHAMAPVSAIQLSVVGFPGVLCRFCDQGSDVSVPYLAARRSRRSAYRRFRDSCRRVAEDGNVRFSTVQSADTSGRHEAFRSDDDRRCRSSRSFMARSSR